MSSSLYGVLPHSWKLIQIRDLISTNHANLQTGPFGTQLLASEYVESGTPVVAVKNIGDRKLTLHDDTPRIDEKTVDRLKRYKLNSGDILFGRKGAVERSALVSDEQNGWLQGSDCIRLRFSTGDIDPTFISFVFETDQHKKWMIRYATGSTMPSLNQDIIELVSIPIPPLEEQRAIADILGTWDEAIALTEALIDALQQRKKGLMQKLLTGEVRFPEFGGEWEEKRFRDVLDIEIGGTPSRKNNEYWDSEKTTENRWLSISDLQGKYVSDSKEYLSDLGAENSNVTLLPPETLVMSFKLTIGKVAILTKSFYTNEAIAALIPKNPEDVEVKYLYHALAVVRFDREIDQAVKGKTLNKAKMARLKVQLPEPDEQHAIARVLDTLDDEIYKFEVYISQLQQQKKGLMQQLLTGQVRVRV